MNFKTAMIFSACCLTLAACGKHDREYFEKHPEEAKKKALECVEKRDKAFWTGDEKAREALKKDSECYDAVKVTEAREKAERKKKWEAEQAEREARREKEEAERKAKEEAEAKARQAKIEKANSDVQAKYGTQNWKEYLATYSNSECADKYLSEDDDTECLPMKKLLETKQEEGRQELAQIPFPELIQQEDTFCKNDRRKYSACSVWKEVTQKQEQELIQGYVKDHDELVKAYNQCVDQYQGVSRDEPDFYKRRNRVLDRYPCRQAIKAKQKLGLGYGYHDEKME